MSDDGVWNRVMAKMSSPFVVISPAVGNKPQKNGGEKEDIDLFAIAKNVVARVFARLEKEGRITVLLDAQHLQLEVKVFSEDQLQYERLMLPATAARPSIVTPHVPSVVVEAETTEEAEKILESGFADVLPFKMEETYYVRQSAGIHIDRISKNKNQVTFVVHSLPKSRFPQKIREVMDGHRLEKK